MSEPAPDGGAARSWFDRLRSGGWPAIEQLVSEKQPETLHIDFKAKTDPAKGPLDRDDRKNLAEALSGFANSDGGVLVWGLDARPGKDGVDRVQGFARITELQGFRAAIEGEPADAISPPVAGLEFHAIENPDQPGAGVVLCLMPASEGGPHMAIAGGQHRYYRRNGSSFLPMEHFEVADLFGRRPRPSLRVDVSWRIRFTGSQKDLVAGIQAEFTVTNDGRAPAVHPCLTVLPPEPGWMPVKTGLSTGYLNVPAPVGAWARVSGSGSVVLFPGDSAVMLSHLFQVRTLASDHGPPDFVIEARGDALDARSAVMSFRLTAEEISRAAERDPRPGGGDYWWKGRATG